MSKLAHLTDIHVRFNSRDREYRQVFNRTYKELEKAKPKRIVVTGDLFHTKINMSPTSTTLGGDFLESLSKIAPVDVILGNHDMNERALEQGNTVEPIINLMENGFVLKEGENPKEYFKDNFYGVYLYKYSGYYNVDEELIYGNYSIWDKGELSLKKEDKVANKKYIALYHAPVYGCQMDNGMVIKKDKMFGLNTFDNFDMVMLGDIHKYQVFDRPEGKLSMAYPGSLIQQNYGESIDKGYLIWDTSDNSHERVIIPNEYGFCKIKVKDVADLEKAVKDKLYFSNDMKKTKIFIEYEDREENYSVEREAQLINFIKEEYGCESVGLNFVSKDVDTKKDEEDGDVSDNFEEALKEFLEAGEYDNVKDVLSLANEIDSRLDIKPNEKFKWDLTKLEVQNLFSMPDEKTVIDFDELKGIIGIFGENYSGKTNVIRSLVWTLWGKILGDGGESKDAINLYSDSRVAEGTCYITMNGKNYKINRKITAKENKAGKVGCAYERTFEIQESDKSWKPVISDEKSTSATEVNKLIDRYFGTFHDFTKVALQVQSGDSDFLSLEQQPKNKLFSKYLDLEHFSDRYNEANEEFKVMKRAQKTLGDPTELEASLKETRASIEQYKLTLTERRNELSTEKETYEKFNQALLDISSTKEQIETIPYTDKAEIEKMVLEHTNAIQNANGKIEEISSWIRTNPRKAIDDLVKNLDQPSLLKTLQTLKETFITKREGYTKLTDWINNNSIKEEVDVSKYSKEIADSKIELEEFKNKLQIAEGKECPTCGTVLQERNPHKEKEYIQDIVNIELNIEEYEGFLTEAREINSHNKLIMQKTNELNEAKVFLINEKTKLEDVAAKLKMLESQKDSIQHNEACDKKEDSISIIKADISKIENRLRVDQNYLDKFEDNERRISINREIELKASRIKDRISTIKVNIDDMESIIEQINREITTSEIREKTLNENLLKIRAADKEYKKYSVYLQAVHRDGIPMQIIKTKLPVINSKINGIIKDVVNFKIELYITDKGDVKERFYFGESKLNSLPLSLSSGSQYFISVLAIRDALHSVSHLTKPTLCAIDEGFGTLDNEKTIEIKSMLDYLKNKYKNVIIITHRSEIKDFVDREIYISRKELGNDAWHSEIST